MADDDDNEAGAYVRATAAMLDMPIDPEHLTGVIANVRLLRQHADRVLGFAIPQGDGEDA